MKKKKLNYHLQRLFVGQVLLISGKIPQCWRSQAGIRFLDSGKFIHTLDDGLNVFFHILDCFCVLALSLKWQIKIINIENKINN